MPEAAIDITNASEIGQSEQQSFSGEELHVW
jgi:hypothetical protein